MNSFNPYGRGPQIPLFDTPSPFRVPGRKAGSHLSWQRYDDPLGIKRQQAEAFRLGIPGQVPFSPKPYQPYTPPPPLPKWPEPPMPARPAPPRSNLLAPGEYNPRVQPLRQPVPQPASPVGPSFPTDIHNLPVSLADLPSMTEEEVRSLNKSIRNELFGSAHTSIIPAWIEIEKMERRKKAAELQAAGAQSPMVSGGQETGNQSESSTKDPICDDLARQIDQQSRHRHHLYKRHAAETKKLREGPQARVNQNQAEINHLHWIISVELPATTLAVILTRKPPSDAGESLTRSWLKIQRLEADNQELRSEIKWAENNTLRVLWERMAEADRQAAKFIEEYDSRGCVGSGHSYYYNPDIG